MIEERFWAKVERGDGCWIWVAGLLRSGYGQFSPMAGKNVRAHRFAYELLVGPIPEGLTLDHLCRVHSCVNPTHLEPVTHLENVRRGMAPNVQIRRSGLCKRGHSLSDAWFGRGGRRVGCKQCQRGRRRATLAPTLSAA